MFPTAMLALELRSRLVKTKQILGILKGPVYASLVIIYSQS